MENWDPYLRDWTKVIFYMPLIQFNFWHVLFLNYFLNPSYIDFNIVLLILYPLSPNLGKTRTIIYPCYSRREYQSKPLQIKSFSWWFDVRQEWENEMKYILGNEKLQNTIPLQILSGYVTMVMMEESFRPSCSLTTRDSHSRYFNPSTRLKKFKLSSIYFI